MRVRDYGSLTPPVRSLVKSHPGTSVLPHAAGLTLSGAPGPDVPTSTGDDDTLRLDGAGIDLDFTAIAHNAVTGIEHIDLTGSGDNTLTVTALDVFNMVGSRESGVAVLHINADAGDVITLREGTWVSAGSVVEDMITYDRYTLGNAQGRVESAISVPGEAPLGPGQAEQVPRKPRASGPWHGASLGR